MGIQLSAQQCLEFGREAVLQTFYTSGVEWMETAVSKAASEGRPAAALRAVQMELEMAKKAVSHCYCDIKLLNLLCYC